MKNKMFPKKHLLRKIQCRTELVIAMNIAYDCYAKWLFTLARISEVEVSKEVR